VANMIYTDIPGWFDYTALYDDACTRGGLMVEVGCFLGRSLVYLASNAPVGASVVGVDHGGVGYALHAEFVAKKGGTLIPTLLQNLTECGVYPEKVSLIVAPSIAAAKLFGDSTIDFLFIDADHACDAVLADITAWRSKVKPGGMIAGHDYKNPDHPGVEEAVTSYFGSGVCTSRFSPSCWEYRTP